ncbi:hypothetical protein Tco_0533857 [Tanacetum coccineum]
MSTSKTYQQSLADVGSGTRPPMLERGSYMPWASRFKRFLNRKRENQKWLLKALENGPYVFRNITPTGSILPRLQEVEDLQRDDLLYYDAEMELTNMILLSIPNEIYNSVDSCKTAKEMWDRVKRLMRGTIQNQVDRETRFTNEFDQFVAEPGESLVSVYNRFAQLINDLERNNMKFPTVSVNTKFLNSLQPEWLKYVTQVRLAKKLTVDSFDDLFDYLLQFEKLVNASRAKKLEKSHDTFVDHMDEYDEVHEMQNDVQHNYVVDSDAKYMSDSNIISYNQYVEDNEENVGLQSRIVNKQERVVKDSLNFKLARYKELAEEYEKQARFELTEREQKIDEQMRIIISDRNRKKTSLKSELHTVQMQLRSIRDQYKSKTEEVTILKKDFKQTEDKYLEEFLDMKKLKDKVKDRLYKQDQSVQTVHMLCRPNPFYDEKKKVAIGYKNPLCLTRAKQVQSALYNGTEIVMTNHKPAVVHDSEETLEIAELTRKRMYEKMKSPLCIQNKVKFAPPDYSKENYLAIFAPQRDLTPEQIFWAKDENDRKKVEASVLKPLSTPTVYPPNTPVKLVPRVLPTKSQVKINLYTLTQLFTEFDKTCKKRITPTGVTEGERGFEQTKRCYLTEVIPFFKTLKQHFEGVQKALFKEVKEMEEIFDQMSAEVDQNTVDKQCAEIERKNLLIANENLIANCLSNQLMFAVEQSRCLDLEAEISKLQNENQKDVNDEMIRGFNKLEVEYLNLQLKYQHLQENFENNKSQTSQDVPEFDSFFRIKILETQLQEKDNVIRNLKAQVSEMNDRSCETYNAKDVTALIEQNECVRVELQKVKQHYKELYDSIKITRAHTNENTSTMLNEIVSLKAQLKSKVSCVTSDSFKPKVLAPGMYAIDVKSIPPPLKNNRSAHLNYINLLKESVKIVREIVEEARVVKPLDNALSYACQYTKLSQKLLEYVIGTCPKSFNERDNKASSTPLTRKRHVTFNDKPGTSSSNTQKHEEHQKVQHSNILVIPSTGVNSLTKASRSNL